MTSSLHDQLTSMSREDLLLFAGKYDSLTDEAQALVRSEFARRGMEAPLIGEESLEVEGLGVRTIRQYRDQAEAFMARSALESAGIGCYLRDENTIRMEWLWSNLMGGMRLQVAESDVEAAEAILSQPIPASIAVAGELDYEQPQCPRCGSLNVSRESLDAKVGAASILLLGFPVPSPVERDAWRCANCGCTWTDDASDNA
jgi:hypothetical protein